MLELRGITAGYGSHIVLRGIDLAVPDRAVVALLGPNGAGKTTLLRIASGIIHPSAGRVALDDEDVTGWPPHRLAAAGVCHVPEGRGIFAGLTVRDNLRLYADGSLDLGAVDVAARAFPRLGERVGQVAGTLSGGEQQMLAMAHAYVTEPNVVLLDEVSMGLAPKIVDEIYHHLRELALRGRSLLLVEQYVGRALDLADYVYVMNKGEITFAGEPGELDESSLAASYLGGR